MPVWSGYLAGISSGIAMKKCSYCGCEKADDAESCRECGTQEFLALLPPTERRPQNRRKRSHILFRIATATLVALVVSGLSLYVAWQNGANAPMARKEQYFTQSHLRELEKQLAAYQQQFKAPPHSLAQLLAMTNGVPPAEEDPLSFDGWKRPFLFSTNGTNCLVTSLGRDGKPGGRGLDCDLTNKDPWPKAATPTLHQFLFDMPAVQSMITCCYLCGVLAFFLCFWTIKLPEPTLPSLTLLAFKLLLTTIGAAIVASIITALHVPSGH